MYTFIQTLSMIGMSSAAVLNQIGRFYIPDSGLAGAENVVPVTDANRLFIADGANLGLSVINLELSDDSQFMDMTYENTLYFSDYAFINTTIDDITSVDYSPKGYVLTCIVPEDHFKNNGWLAFVDPFDLSIAGVLELEDCFLPDHVTTAQNGDLIIISCEGEPDDNEAEFPQYNPQGSITVIDTYGYDDIADKDQWTITNIKFDDYNIRGAKHSQLPTDIYLPHSDATVAQNIEPEYTSCDHNGDYCYTVLQENNAVAVLDLDLFEIVAIYTLGTKDFGEYGLDASDKDGIINIDTYPGLYGLRMPDNIKCFQSESGREYFLTANEGDSKGFDETRVKDLILDETVFGNVTALQQKTVLGRLKVVNQLGYVMNGSDKIYNELYAFSSRDFTIFEVDTCTENVPTITEVFSSNSDFETITAEELGETGFNSNAYNPSFDTRSDDKGPEPESVMVGTCNNGRMYAFIGLERVGGVMVYDITFIDDGLAEFVEYENNRNFSIPVEKDTRAPENAGDFGPEQMRFIDENVYGIPLLVVAAAESASVTVYEIDCEDMSVSTTDSGSSSSSSSSSSD